MNLVILMHEANSEIAPPLTAKGGVVDREFGKQNKKNIIFMFTYYRNMFNTII